VIGYDAIEYAHRTDVGIRRNHNQDDFGIRMAGNPDRWREQGHLFIVADGMGGHAVGEKAAARAARDIPHLVPRHVQDDPATALRKAYLEANSAIYNIGQENPEFRGLGTTATTLWLRPEGAWIGHVGDSRVYRFRADTLEQLTFDHSAIWELARRQGVSPDQMTGIRSNVILRSLGPEPLVEVDVEGPYPLEPGDTFLICSDGLSGQLSDYEIGAVLNTLEAQEACDFLVELANLRGGPDNITVLIIRVRDTRTTFARKAKSSMKWPQVPWPTVTMIGGIALSAFALGLYPLGLHRGAAFVFIVAALAVLTGLAGLVLHSRKLELEEVHHEPRANVYNRTRCVVEPTLIEKLNQAETNVLEKLDPADREQVETEIRQFRSDAKGAHAKGELVAAFRAHCRVMHAIVRKYNAHRQKEEVFTPVWDKSEK
jgi:PPM family protein phosphatase